MNDKLREFIIGFFFLPLIIIIVMLIGTTLISFLNWVNPIDIFMDALKFVTNDFSPTAFRFYILINIIVGFIYMVSYGDDYDEDYLDY